MCHKLLQVFVCGHTKEVCTTPCDHAVRTATPVSGPPPSTAMNMHRPELQMSTHHSSIGSPTATQAQDRDELSRSPQHTRMSTGTTAAPGPRLSLNMNTNTNPRNSLPPPPYTPHITTTPPSLTTDLKLDPTLPTQPNFCAQFLALYLARSIYPCYACYLNADYAGIRREWMRGYREQHPGVKGDDVERLSGVEGVGVRLGKMRVGPVGMEQRGVGWEEREN